MMMVKKVILTLLLVLMAGLFIQAQEDEQYIDEAYEEYAQEPTGIFFSFDFHSAIPVYPTNQRLNRPVFGIHTQLLYQPDKYRGYFFGLGFSFGRYDQEDVEYFDFTDFEENLFRENTNCNIMQFHLRSRYFPGYDFWVFQPFLDISFVFRNSFAYTTVSNVDYDENVSTRFEDGDWGLGFDVGVGTLIDFRLSEENVFGHFTANYSGGQNSFFYLIKDNTTGFEEPIDRFDRRSIPFHFVNINAGIIVYF